MGFSDTMIMADSDLSSSILSPSPLIRNSVEPLDESSSPIGAHVVQSNRDRDDQDSLSWEASIRRRDSDGSSSTWLNETLIVPSPVSSEHSEYNATNVMPESQILPVNHSESQIGSASRAPDETDDEIWDACLSDNRQLCTPNVSSDSGTDDDDSTMERIQYLLRSYQEPLKIKKPPTGVGAGLWNLGNTCFLNSVLQCFTHTVPLIKSLRSFKYQDPCNCGNKEFCVIRFLRSHIEFALMPSINLVSPYYFLDNLNYFSPDFQLYQQEDAHEFLQAFLDKLERCCLDRRSYRGSISSQDVNIVENVFGGRLVSMLRCCNCNSVSETFEQSLGLSLGIEDVDNLWSALDSFTRVEKLEEQLTCDNCKEKVSKEKQLLLDKLPLVATFHLKRFKNNGFFMEKIFKHVEFPLELDLQPYMSSSQNNEVATKYHLYALVKHLGSLAYGHYSSYVRSAPKIWHKFDDVQVTRIDEDSVLSQDSYILFYVREGTPWFSRAFEVTQPLLEASLQNPSPKTVLDPTNGECLSEISFDNVVKSNKPCDSAGVSIPHVKTEENCVSLSNESHEDVFLSAAESSGEDSPMTELLDALETVDEKEADSCLAFESATTGDDFVPLLMVQNQDSSPKQQEVTFQIQPEHLETTKNQEEEVCKQPSLISDIAESKETDIARRDVLKKPSSRARELDQAISKTASPPKKIKTA